MLQNIKKVPLFQLYERKVCIRHHCLDFLHHSPYSLCHQSIKSMELQGAEKGNIYQYVYFEYI